MNTISKYGYSKGYSLRGFLHFRYLPYTFLFLVLILINGCIKQFVPGLTEDQDLLVVEGLITDQAGSGKVKLSTSMPLGLISSEKPLSGCNVSISDDLGNFYSFIESDPGTYTPPSLFQGKVGRYYTLHINTNTAHHNLSYQSAPVLMSPVPPIDSVYYDKIILSRASDGYPSGEGCQIYLNTHDPQNICKFYRWEYVETWEFGIPYVTPYNVCWITNHSDVINIKNASSFSENRITRQAVNFVSNATDRLKVRYSILVNQFSIDENEFNYWDKLNNVTGQVGSLYDIIPSSIFSNIRCIEKPAENVLGYFSVSSVKSKRIFISNEFRGMPNTYTDCENASVGYLAPIPGLGVTVWVIIDHPEPPPGYKVLTYHKGCYDCRVRGTNIKPDFWDR